MSTISSIPEPGYVIQHPLTLIRRAERDAVTSEDDDERKTSVRERQLREWDDHLDLWYDALFTRNIKLAQTAKILADTLRVRQVCEAMLLADMGKVGGDEDQLRRRFYELARSLGIGE